MNNADERAKVGDDAPAAYYAEPGAMTDLRVCGHDAFVGLPTDPESLCRVAQGLLVHEEWAPLYGVSLAEKRRQEVRTRPATQMVEVIQALDPAPLVTVRPPERRMVGNCRHFSTLTCALLRHHGIPARARCGFGAYFEAGPNVDHWVVEYWRSEERRWVRCDSQLDELQRACLKLDFDSEDMPAEPFLPAGEAWTRCRKNQADPDAFGIFDMWGLWFVHNNVVRDLAALNKLELLPWDNWGMMTFRSAPDPEALDLTDEVATVVASANLSSIRALYAGNERLRVPDTVFDARFAATQSLK